MYIYFLNLYLSIKIFINHKNNKGIEREKVSGKCNFISLDSKNLLPANVVNISPLFLNPVRPWTSQDMTGLQVCNGKASKALN